MSDLGQSAYPTALNNPEETAVDHIRRSVDRSFRATGFHVELCQSIAKVLWFFDWSCITKNHIFMVCEMVLLHKSEVRIDYVIELYHTHYKICFITLCRSSFIES